MSLGYQYTFNVPVLQVVAGGGSSNQYTPWGTTLKREIDPADWSGTVLGYLETHGKTSNASFPVVARLFNETTNTPVTGSGTSTAGLTSTRARSSSFSFTAGDNTYRVEFGGLIGATYTLFDAVVIVDVS